MPVYDYEDEERLGPPEPRRETVALGIALLSGLILVAIAVMWL